MRKSSFVTGASGLLGGSLVEKLLIRGDQVVCLVRDQVPTSRLFLEPENYPGLIIIRGDILDRQVLRRVLYEYEINSVFHLAAQTLVGVANQDPIDTLKVNIEGTWNLLEEFRQYCGSNKRPKALIIASSDKAYGNMLGESYDEGSRLQGEHPYDVSKSCCDLISQSYAKTYALPIAITRCGNFFGPGDLNGSRIIPGTILSVLRGEAPVIRSDGSLIRDYIYSDDGAGAYICLEEAFYSEKRKSLKIAYNFSYGEKRTVSQVTDAVLKLMKSDLKPVVLNEAKHEIPAQHLNSALARKDLEWKPQFGFEDGLQKTIRWYQKYQNSLNFNTR